MVRNASFFDSLRRDENIVVAGPSTLSALLNSLAVGFKTLNIQKNANDISKILGNVKVEFEKFGNMLVKAQNKSILPITLWIALFPQGQMRLFEL